VSSKTSDERGTRPGALERILRVFGEVRKGEGLTIMLMASNIFVVLVAYYVIKTVREPLILTTGGAELKAYAAAVQALLLVIAVPVYSYFDERVETSKLVFGVTAFFLVCIEAFFLAYDADVPMLGFAFFVWVGIFNLAIVAQFWSFGNEIYARETGERVFPLIAIGATVGAPVGAWIAGALLERGLSVGALMQVAAGLLLVQLLLYRITLGRPDATASYRQRRADDFRSILGGFALVFRNRYLALIALMLVLLNLVNSTGEYLLSTFAERQAEAALADALQRDPSVDVNAFMAKSFGLFYSAFFFWVNILGVALQAFVASRIVKYLGVAGLLFVLPVVALANYGWLALGLGFGAFRWLKTVENATDYSIMNTGKATLWLPTTHREKFQAKQAVDTFFVRVGDVLAAMVVYVGTELTLSTSGFARVNVAVVLVWLGVTVLVWRRYRRRSQPNTA
jgi:AAA family ATP:ADP antiporter